MLCLSREGAERGDKCDSESDGEDQPPAKEEDFTDVLAGPAQSIAKQADGFEGGVREVPQEECAEAKLRGCEGCEQERELHEEDHEAVDFSGLIRCR